MTEILTKTAPRPLLYLTWYHKCSISDVSALCPSNPLVLDLGCGEGLLIKDMPNDINSIGADLSHSRLVYAKKQNPEKIWVNTAANTLPFADASLDAVILHQVIEHLDCPAIVIRELSRIIKPNGIIIISTPVPKILGHRFARSRNSANKRVLSPDHIYEYKSLEEFVNFVHNTSSNTLSLIKPRERYAVLPLARLFPFVKSSLLKRLFLPLVFYYTDIYVVFRKTLT